MEEHTARLIALAIIVVTMALSAYGIYSLIGVIACD